MERYVLKDNHYFNVYKSKGRHVIIPNKNNIGVLKEILKIEKQNYFSSMINSFLNKEIPLNWIRNEFIRDYEFVEKYYPEYLV